MQQKDNTLLLRHLFHDPDVELVQQHDGRLPVACERTLLMPENFGFCNGVRGALRGVEKALTVREPGKIWITGEIIHNPTVNHCLRKAGLRIVEETHREHFFQRAAQDDVIVIPAFGVDQQLVDRLSRQLPDNQIIDTTCGYVKRAWNFARKAVGDGRTLMVFGNPEHQEIKAVVSRVLEFEQPVVFLRNLKEAEDFSEKMLSGEWRQWLSERGVDPDKTNLRKPALISQTTLLLSDVEQAKAAIGRAVHDFGGELLYEPTVCRATEERQKAASEICREGCDLFLVVGGYSSSNTNQLFRIAREHGKAFFIRDASALQPKKIIHYAPEKDQREIIQNWLRPEDKRIGILAGASCPASDIGDVIRWFKNL